jgi:folate-binding protein YgfZ
MTAIPVTDPAHQVAAATQGALAVPQPDLATLVVTGGDRIVWLNGMLTCDLLKRAAGAAMYGLAVARNGKVITDVVVIDDARERAILVVPRTVVEALRAHLDHYLVMEDAVMDAATDGFEAWAVHGPKAEGALAAAQAAGGVGGLLDRTGLGGAVVLAPREKADAVRNALATVATLGDEAGWEALRLERAVPRFGVDFDDKTYPQEAQLEKQAVSFTKGCYLGQEVVCMLELRGHVKRMLVPVVFDAGEPPARGAQVTDEAGAAIGEVTTAGASPTLGKPVVLAMVKRAFAQAGSHVLVAGVRGEVVARPA